MADAVADAIEGQHHLVVEAGTGVGKSFAYLVPAILATAEKTKEWKDKGDKEAPPPRVIISTHTISLQEQLLTKDIPLLRSVMPVEFTAVLAKGRRNYISLRRMKNAMGRAARCSARRKTTSSFARSTPGRRRPATARWPT